ncbi:MAG: hypothetical protein ACE15B_07790 [Bryobacteraceae bacterium]
MRRDVAAAMLAAAIIIAHQTAGKAIRDALFLSQFPVSSLPAIVAATAAFSVLMAMAAGCVISRCGPARLIPAAFAASAALHLGEWVIAGERPGIAAVVCYLHVGGVATVLISGFWSVVNERFDPRTAKRQMGRIAGGGTAGGVLGGILAERLGAHFGIQATLAALAVLHVLCSAAVKALGDRKAEASAPAQAPAPGALGVLARAPYLRGLAWLVLLGAASAASLDYVLKAQAVETFGRGEPLLRFFGIFQSGVALVTFLLQASATHFFLNRLGLARTVGSLPATVAAGGLGMIFMPALGVAAAARGAEMVVRNSLFRSGYELFYTPVSAGEKRSVKSFIDVACDRAGDAIGSGIVRALLLLGPAARPLMLLVAAVCGVVAAWLAGRLDRGYVDVLERRLLEHSMDLDPNTVDDATTRQILLHAGSGGPRAGPAWDPFDPEAADLRSGDPARVRRVLGAGPVPRELVPHVVALLAWDEMAPEALAALRRTASLHAGQLADHLLDMSEHFIVRRRIPRILTAAPGDRAASGLVLGLNDPRFEVRYRSARALTAMVRQDPEIRIPPAPVYQAVMRELEAGPATWQNYRLIDPPDDSGDTGLDPEVREPSGLALEYVFTLLSLVLPAQPVATAYRGVFMGDRHLRGTALEYLDSALPAAVRRSLRAYVERRPERRR